MGRGARIAALAALTATLLVVGWWVFWFQCDDAYIAFRYVQSRRLGWGYTWNPPPMRAVEGYTSFLWVVLLDGLWTLTGRDPTVTANRVALAASLVTTGLVGLAAWRLPLSAAWAPHREKVLAGVWIGTVTNRTWLAWSSSGLETSLFTALLWGWALVGVTGAPGAWAIAWSTLAGLLALCRPDGLLYVAATGAVLVARAVHARRVGVTDVAAALPFAIPVAHLLWRHATYGEWVPNTYFAKHVGIWPVGGVFYATGFALEYAAWLPVGLAAWWAWRSRPLAPAWAGWALGWRARPFAETAAVAVLGTFAFEWAYYTFDIGGDHFEWRIYHHLVPVLFLAVPYVTDRLGWHPRDGLAALALGVMLSWPIPWTHWWITKDLDTRRETHVMVRFVSDAVPFYAKPYALAFDLVEWWLIEHHSGMRHQEHKVFAEEQWRRYGHPPADFGDVEGDVYVHDAFSVGVPGWAMPHVVIIDKLGLNDRVVARTPVDTTKERTMAHDRRPPAGYVACFRPNVRYGASGVIGAPHSPPLRPEDLAACEARFSRR